MAESLKTLTHAQRVERFGSFSYAIAEKGDPDGIVIDPPWVRQNIALFDVQQIIDIRDDDPFDENWHARFHRLAGHALVALWQAWDDAGLLDRVLAFNGGWVARYKRGRGPARDARGKVVGPIPGPSRLSNHSWGTAFDINAKQNPLGSTPAALGVPGCVRELVPLAEKHRFAWGGNFGSRPDGMHFEYIGEG